VPQYPSGRIRSGWGNAFSGWPFATLAEVPAKRRIGVIGEIADEMGPDNYRKVGSQAAFLDRIVFVGARKHMQPLCSGAVKARFKPESFERVRTADEALELLRDYLEPNDVVFIKGRWQQALGRVGLALAGKDVQCRADPCPFKRMLCDVCRSSSSSSTA
jgi:hypothetical protein